MNTRQGAAALSLASLLALGACTPQPPVRLGFLGGLSGRVSDLGEAGRNGAQLAVEQANATGGVGGRAIELSMRDDQQNKDSAIKAAESLIQERVDAIVGPMTSAVAEWILPTIQNAGVVTVSPTITASTLSAKDDFLFKIAPSVAENGQRSAQYQYAQGSRRAGIVFDLSNRAYTADWAEHWGKSFVALGGAVVAQASFTSGDDQGYAAAIKQVSQAKPDVLLFVTNAVDTVRLTQLARNLGLAQPVTTSTWAGTENLIQLGGRTVEGMTVTQFFNRDDSSVGYRAFADAYRLRFKQEPGFASVAAYDATRATLQALAVAGKGGPKLKQALLAAGPYRGLQESWNFDRFGDARRRTFVTVVRNGGFTVVE
jgi:branched-chain amino acid transport system substrate-binding protein